MWHFILALAIVLIAVFGILRAKDGPRTTAKHYKENLFARFIEDGKLEREEIRTLLNNLPTSLDRKLKPGAMCYSVAASTLEKSEYSCPLCGTKTVYTKDADSSLMFRVEYLENYRRVAGQIKGLWVELDEKQFCSKCSPDVKHPKLCLKVTHPGDNKIHIVEDIDFEDLKLLEEFSRGNVIHAANRGREVMLRQYKSHLAKLLGIEEK